MIDTSALLRFRRKFSINPYKSLRLPLGEMSLHADWVNTDRGSPYPVLPPVGKAESETGISEAVEKGEYRATRNEEEYNGDGEKLSVRRRLLGQHFPYATYSLDAVASAAIGFSFICDGNGGGEYTAETAPAADIYVDGELIKCDVYVGGVLIRSLSEPNPSYPFAEETLSVACRGNAFDVYIGKDGGERACTFELTEFAQIRKYVNFRACSAALFVGLYAGGKVCAKSINWYLDGGISHADIRPIRYEDGTPMTENGRIFMTVSSRIAVGAFQSVISWDPFGCSLKLEGALFFDAGDGAWCSDVASSVLYDRASGRFLLWLCSFSHGHILAHGTSEADLRHGIHVIDVTLMPSEAYAETSERDGTDPGGGNASGKSILSDDRLFMAKSGDEDPDFYYDASIGRWFLTVCRPTDRGGNGKEGYEYMRFVSEKPFEGYTFISRTNGTQETGGSTVKIGNRRYFMCGSRFDSRALYNAYLLGEGEKGEFIPIGHPICDFDDGGFRGWGTVIPVPCGNRMKYMWMTFDRYLASSIHRWSYGNLYVFESDLFPTVTD